MSATVSISSIRTLNKHQWEASPFTKREKLHTEVFDKAADASKAIAAEIAKRIISKQELGENCVLGLATGSSPKSVYKELIRMHREEGLSFKNVITFNLDEYYPMPPDALQSYVRFMNEQLFDHVDIPKENIHIPNGSLDKSDVQSFCQTYEEKIEKYGGLDIQILGIGRTGHIGFNEPGSSLQSTTRMINLDHITRIDAASDFFGEENVPVKAITMGIGTILKARRIIIMAWGEGKAKICQHAIEEEVSDSVPATYLQYHANTTFVVDSPAGAELTRLKTPWVLGSIDWTDELKKRAVIWLSDKMSKPVLKLTDREYSDNGMSDLILDEGPAYNINIRIFNELQHTITGWPGGKPNVDDTYRPERAAPARKTVLLFSPHPDDDVISMGGTFIRLVDQGHDVHVAYQTSGNIAVFDEDVIRFADFFQDFDGVYNKDRKSKKSIYEEVKEAIRNKNPGDVDAPIVQDIKALIRRSEAKAGCRYVGIPDENMHFMNMPFYETGTIEKNPIGPEDVQITAELIRRIQPHQIYAAGDLSDPHGTHRVCLDAIFQAVDTLKSEAFMNDCWVWLYRGAWQEWSIEDIEMAVPLSPSEVLRKKRAIFKHQSQKDSALFPGNDPREFWQRAEDRNKLTAEVYNNLGLPEYEAMEAFKRYHF
ncbi:MAG: glucosamine-6-phosphate deaminase [Cyclobacteriaceae bacterium]